MMRTASPPSLLPLSFPPSLHFSLFLHPLPSHPLSTQIKRPYFHVKPLERLQLKNWRDYLDYEISQGDPRRIEFLFERCVVSCALYEDFWSKVREHSLQWPGKRAPPSPLLFTVYIGCCPYKDFYTRAHLPIGSRGIYIPHAQLD